MEYEFLTWDVTDHVATIMLNRPEKLNALSQGLRQDIYSACDQAVADDNSAWYCSPEKVGGSVVEQI